MSIVFRKSAKGLSEIETRAFRLPPRLRQALILVDGRKSELELAALLGPEAQATLAALRDGAFIEALVTVADAPPAPPTAAPRKPARPVETIAREAVRQLTEQLGPAAEGIAIKLERARTHDELQPLLVGAAQLLKTVRGAAAAQTFAARFLPDGPGVG